MKTAYKALLVLVVAAVIVFAAYSTIFKLPLPRTGGKPETIPEIEAIQLNPGPNYIQQLEETITSSDNSSIREAAILALADIAIRKAETEKVVDFLKNIATSESDDVVRSAAYAAVDLIRENYPLPSRATLSLHIGGDFRKGGNMTLFVYVNATVNTEATVGIDALREYLDLLSPTLVATNVTANVPREVQFKFYVKEVGEYAVSVTMRINYDRVDYESITKKIFFSVHENYGEVLAITGA